MEDGVENGQASKEGRTPELVEWRLFLFVESSETTSPNDSLVPVELYGLPSPRFINILKLVHCELYGRLYPRFINKKLQSCLTLYFTDVSLLKFH